MDAALTLVVVALIVVAAGWFFLKRREGSSRFGSSPDGSSLPASPPPSGDWQQLCARAQFDGIADGLDVVVSAEQNWGPGQGFRIECRFRTAGRIRRKPAQVLVGRDEWARGTGSGVHWWLGLWGRNEDNPGKVGRAACVLRDRDGNSVAVSGRRRLDDRRWHHVLADYDAVAGRLTLYLDGNLEGSEPARLPAGFASAVSPFNVGWLNHAMHGGKNNYYRFHGEVDHVRVGCVGGDRAAVIADTSASTAP